MYIADAPYQRLPLIGGEHDWAFLLGPGGLADLSAARPLSTAMTIVGAALVLAGIGVCFAAPLLHRTRTSPVSKPNPVRQPQQWVERELTSGFDGHDRAGDLSGRVAASSGSSGSRSVS